MFGRMKKNTKGSVLYTVVAVMMIMTAFVCAVLTLAASANRRAHVNYANNQTQYTARSVIDTVWSEIRRDSELSSKVFGKSGTVSLSIKGIDSSMGKVTKASVTKIGGENSKTYKLAVTVEMLGQESTIAGYYDVKQLDNRPNFAYSFVSLDHTELSGINSFGGVCLSIEPDYSAESGGSITNESAIDSPVHVNGNFKSYTKDMIKVYPDSGIFVAGDITIGNTQSVTSVISNNRTPLKYRSLPYVYAYQAYYGSYEGGVIRYSANNITMGDKDNPVLVAASSLIQNTSNVNNIYGDLYLYGKYETSVFGVNGVFPWERDVLAKRMAGSDTPYTGGNIYSLGEVLFKYNESADLAHNIIASKLSLHGEQSKTVSISGAAVVNNLDITVSGTDNNLKINMPDGVYVDPDKFTHEKADGTEIRNIAINGVQYGKRKYYVDSDPSYEESGKGTPVVVNTKNSERNYYWNQNNAEIKIGDGSVVYSVYNDKNELEDVERTVEQHIVPFELGEQTGPIDAKGNYQYYFRPTSVTIKWNDTSNKIKTRSWKEGGFEYKNYTQIASDVDFDIHFKGYNAENNLEEYASLIKVDDYTNRKKTVDANNKTVTYAFEYPVNRYVNSFNNNFLEITLSGGTADYGDWEIDWEIDWENFNPPNPFKYKWVSKLGANDSRLPAQVLVESITINFNKYLLKYNPPKTVTGDYDETNITFLKAANDEAFSKHNTATPGVDVIQLDDIDKSVRLVKTTQDVGGNIVEKYFIYKHDFTVFRQGIAPYASCFQRDEEGTEGSITFDDYELVGEYSGDTSDITYDTNGNPVYNYKRFLKDVVETACYPKTMSVTQQPRELFDAENLAKPVQNRVTLKYAPGDRPDIVDDAGNVVYSYTGKTVEILAYRFQNGNVWTNFKSYTDVNGQQQFYCYATENGNIIDVTRPEDDPNRIVHLYYTNGEEVPASFIDNHPDIPIYNYITGTNRKTGKVENMTVDLFNGMISREQYGFLGFADDTPLYGNYVSSNLRDRARKEVNEAFTKHDEETKRLVYEFESDDNHDLGLVTVIENGVTVKKIPSDELTVTQSCTFRGTVSRSKINIIPTSDIYIRLENFILGSSNENKKSNFYIDDSAGRVNFLIPKRQNTYICGNILTKYYYDQYYEYDEVNGVYTGALTGKTIQVPNNPAIDMNPKPIAERGPEDRPSPETDDSKIPDVYIYMEYDEYTDIKEKVADYKSQIETIKAAAAAAAGPDVKASDIKDDDARLTDVQKTNIATLNGNINTELDKIKNKQYNKFEFNKGANIVTAYILAPTGHLKMGSDTGKTTFNVAYYTDLLPAYVTEDGLQGAHKEMVSAGNIDPTAEVGTNVSSKNVIIGACIFGDAELGDQALFVGYVNPNPKDEEGKEMKSSIPKLQYYQAY